MATYSVTLTDAEVRAMQHVAINAEDWIKNAFQHRVDTAFEGLANLEMRKAFHYKQPIIADKSRLVEESTETLAVHRISAEDYVVNPDDPFRIPTVTFK